MTLAASFLLPLEVGVYPVEVKRNVIELVSESAGNLTVEMVKPAIQKSSLMGRSVLRPGPERRGTRARPLLGSADLSLVQPEPEERYSSQ